jgi:hypothetical protein
LYQQVENLALVVDRSPALESSAGDQNRHLIEMPVRGWPMTSPAKLLVNNGPNFNIQP